MKGIYAAVAVPLKSDLSIHHEELARHSCDLIERGCAGIALFGTTGEGASFSVKERIEALGLLAKKMDPGQIILGNGSSGISDTAELCRSALDCGSLAMLISPPSYYKGVAEAGTIAYYREIIKRISHPRLRVILYHYPKLTGVPITMEVISALHREFPEIVVGIKESEGDLSFTKSVLAQFPRFKVFVGKESQIAEAVQAGGAGAICGLANLYPELIRAFYEKPEPAHFEKLESISRKFRLVPFNAGVKSVLEMQRGDPWSSLVPPLCPLSISEKNFFLNEF